MGTRRGPEVLPLIPMEVLLTPGVLLVLDDVVLGLTGVVLLLVLV